MVALNIILVYRGLSGGIEKFCSFALPAMAVLAVIVLIRVLTLGTPNPALPDQNVLNGLGFLWNPDFSKLTDFETWLAAAGQIFFSLSVGFGVILNYASYLKKEDDIALSGFTASATNELFEVGFGGLITITAAFVFLGASGVGAGSVLASKPSRSSSNKWARPAVGSALPGSSSSSWQLLLARFRCFNPAKLSSRKRSGFPPAKRSR